MQNIIYSNHYNTIYVNISVFSNSIHNGDQRKGSYALEELFKIKDENSEWFNF